MLRPSVLVVHVDFVALVTEVLVQFVDVESPSVDHCASVSCVSSNCLAIHMRYHMSYTDALLKNHG